MSKSLIAAICFCIGSQVLARPIVGKPAIVLKSSDYKIDVYYGDKLRLQGGHFLFQSRNIQTGDLMREGDRFIFETPQNPIEVRTVNSGDVVSFFVSQNENASDSGDRFLGFFFDSIPGFAEGMTFYRYGPWNSWTRPEKIDSVVRMQKDDIQFFYWRYSDGLYGAAVPISGQGYRSTLGQYDGHFGAEAVSYYDGLVGRHVPQMAVGFGTDPYKLFSTLYREALEVIGKGEDLVSKKIYPDVFRRIGWCSWNASVYGTKLNDQLLLNSAQSFSESGFPVKWFLIDDGWLNNTNSMLNTFSPDTSKFPEGFRPVIQKLKHDYGIPDVGIWHAFDGYWDGINPDSPLGREFRSDLFSWTEKTRPDVDTSNTKTCYFILPFTSAIDRFYQGFEGYLRGQGFSFVKVDNQLVTERMAPGKFPIFSGAERYHAALNAAVASYFRNAMINCMDMTPDAYLNFGSTAVARAEDDYWPEYDTRHSENYWFGRAGEHVAQEVFNSIYFSQMVYPDFDMFESVNPAAKLYVVAHAINDGPTYITDKIGEHDFNVLWPLVYSNGELLRADKPLLPAEDCLFSCEQHQGSPFLKAFSMDRNVGLLGIWNCWDSTEVSGTFSPSDVHGISADSFAVYEYFTNKLVTSGLDDTIPVTIGGYGCRLYYVVPTIHGNAVLGLVDKYNAPASVVRQRVSASRIEATIREGGKFAAVISANPVSVKVNGKEFAYNVDGKLIFINIPVTGKMEPVRVEIIL